MGIAKVMHFERLILQIYEKNEKLEVTASIWEDGTMLVSVCHVAWTFTVWADLFQSRPLGWESMAIVASTEAQGEDTFLVFYTSGIKGKCHSHSLGQCPIQPQTS